jgi:ribosomal protein L19
MGYFIYLTNDKNLNIITRRSKKNILNNFNASSKFYIRGDIITINFWVKSYNCHFEGICISLKNKNIINPNVKIILRNVIIGVGIEMQAAYFLNRLYLNIYVSDYKRKQNKYRPSKLYYLRDKKNKATKIKA